jgi:hypothetical protein
VSEPAEFTVAEFIEGAQDGTFTPDKGEAKLVWRYYEGRIAAHMWLWQGGRIVGTIPAGTVVGSARIHWHQGDFR